MFSFSYCLIARLCVLCYSFWQYYALKMDSSSNSSEREEYEKADKSKKIRFGRMSNVMKRLRLSTHELGSSCNCKRFKCFQVISEKEQKRIIKEFNEMNSYDEQNTYLSGLITVIPVQDIKVNPVSGRSNNASYNFRVRTQEENSDTFTDTQICYKAFLALHGITARRIQTIQKSLVLTGVSPIDHRGKHGNRPHKLSEETVKLMNNFIKSLKVRKSHYALKDSSKLYLPSELNISNLCKLYNEINKTNTVSYETFRSHFTNNFNISFVYPRKDTCSTCDLYNAKETAIKTELEKNPSVSNTLTKLQTEQKLHLKKAEQFYSTKKYFRKLCMKSDTTVAITMDYQKNLPTPNLTTNDVYYRRQLNFYSFNIHVLSSNEAIFFTYDESVARKGSDDVCSFLNNYVTEILPKNIKYLIIFCDSCGGQNKNYTVIRFLHYLVVEKKRLDSIKVIFPIRGHSYLESDRDMSLVNQKAYVEKPDDWREVFLNSRRKPKPFSVINCKRNFFKSWTQYLKPFYKAKCPFPTRPIRTMEIKSEFSKSVFCRNSYYGPYKEDVIQNKSTSGRKMGTLQDLYNGPLPINQAKFSDLQHLSKFLTNSDAKLFYNNLITETTNLEDSYEDVYLDYPEL